MNSVYFEYLESIKAPTYSKAKVKSAVKAEISEKNKKKALQTRIVISMAACLAIFAGALSVSKYNNNSKIDENYSTTQEKTISINDDQSTKDSPQRIIIGNKYYFQYAPPELEEKLKVKNNKAEIKQSDIGKLICTLDEKNIIDMDDLDENTLDKKSAEKNEFYDAEVYSVKSIDSSLILVKTSKNYYYFHLVDLKSASGFDDILKIYSLDKSNKISSIEVWQDEIVDDYMTVFNGKKIKTQTSKDIKIKTISQEDKINEIISLFSSSKFLKSEFNGQNGEIYDELHSIGIDESMKDAGEYRLIFKLSNGNSFEIWVKKNCNYAQMLEATFFKLTPQNAKKLIDMVK